MESRWYVIHVHSGCEQKVARSIRKQLAFHGLENKIEEMRVPDEEIVTVARPSGSTAEHRFYPGYLLAKMDLTEEVWALIKETPQVIPPLGGASRPEPVHSVEVSRYRQ
jgi:transcriptional antiterminator NusG